MYQSTNYRFNRRDRKTLMVDKVIQTDTAFSDGTLYVADGYGANYISTADPTTGKWKDIFAGKTSSPSSDGLFGTAHGLGNHPNGHHLSIADRPHARFQHFSSSGHFHSTHNIQHGSKLFNFCGRDVMRPEL